MSQMTASVWTRGSGGWRLQGRGGLRKEEGVPEDENKSGGGTWLVAIFPFWCLLLLCSGGLSPSRGCFPSPLCFILSRSTSLVLISSLCSGTLLNIGESGSLCPHRSQPVRMQTANKRSQHSMLSVMARKEVSKEIATTLGPERYV